ncbi:unnamed protein product [Cylicocyclus nassatus]|uniref:Uncharacterized protein n=1 Tax=Cylicocyclus nassatus TaxID=53992 RepID=A0AA36GV01_CYLNA|nr:unnamed protein product [Cylicocyclus nassatus]
MFEIRPRSVRAYGEAVNEYVTRRSHQRQVDSAHVAELQRREQQNREVIENSNMENQDYYGEPPSASNIAADEDITSNHARNHDESTSDPEPFRMSVFERAIYYAITCIYQPEGAYPAFVSRAWLLNHNTGHSRSLRVFADQSRRQPKVHRVRQTMTTIDAASRFWLVCGGNDDGVRLWILFIVTKKSFPTIFFLR